MTEREQLEQAIAHMEAQRAALGDAVVDAAIATLREKLAALEAPAPLEQRKQITVLFADVSGFTAMSETMDAEEVHDTLNRLWTRLDGAITAHDGMIDKHIGDEVMALFGAPTAREDDPERAIRAALAMQAELAAFREARQVALAMRIGINTGPVLLGEVGTTAEYTAMGDTVNVASRLQHVAPVDGILISHDTHRHVRGVFDVQALEPIRVKGKAQPIQVYVVHRVRPRTFRVTTRGVEGIETRMIGRETELQRLQEVLNAVMGDGEARAVTVVGDAGVGKSRLLHEFHRWLGLLPHGVTVLRGRASQEMTTLPYSLVRDLLASRFEIKGSDRPEVAREKLERGIVARLDADGAEKAHVIGQLIGFDFSESPHLRGIIADAQQIHDRAFHYVAQYFVSLTQKEPAILFLEDIHWADDGSLDLVEHLLGENRHFPLLVIALARPELLERRPSWGQGREYHARLDLRPLSIQDSRRLVGEILRHLEAIPPDLQELIVGGAEGNPFYVEELIKMLIEDGVIIKGPDRWRVEMDRLAEVRVPPTLTGVLQARLDGLPLRERETLQRASVVGRVFWDDVVARIGAAVDEREGVSETNTALHALQGKELVFERKASAFVGTQECIFKHAVLRDVTYESVLKRLRRVYHAQVAVWLIEHSGERVGEYAGLIGDHYERADENAEAAEWYGRAGRQAQETYALEAAAGYYQKALAWEERWEWCKGQAEVLHILGRRDEEQAALRALEGASKAPVFEVAYLWGQYHEAVGDYAQARAAVERAMAACRDEGDVVGQVRCLARLGLIVYRQGDYDRAKEWYSQALGLLQDRDAYLDDEAQALAQALNGVGTVYRQQGQFERAKASYERALTLSQMVGDRMSEARTYSNLGVTAYYQRDFAEALTYHQRALEIRRAIGDRTGEGMSLGNLAQIAREAGDYGQAEENFLAVLSILQNTGNRWDEVNVWNELGILHRELGNLAEAQRCLQKGLALTEEIGDDAGQAYLLCNLGLVACERDDLDTAEELLARGLALAQKQDDKHLVSIYLSYQSVVSLRAGELDQATARAEAALALRQEAGLSLTTADDLSTLAAAHLAAHDAAQSLRYAQQALAVLKESDGEGLEFPQRDYYIGYRVLMAVGQEEAAHAALQSAYALVSARADKITDPALRQSFLERVRINREIMQEYLSVMRKA